MKEKPWLSSDEQIRQLELKGVSFGLVSKGRACRYLSESNTYFRLRSYRKNFAKHTSGQSKGRYINLDFGMLVDLANIDMRLREEMLKLSLDIEHFAKVSLLASIAAHGEDGYAVVEDFMGQQKSNGYPLDSEFNQGKSSTYIAELLSSRPSANFPAWEFVELISFGRMVHFYSFCAERFSDSYMRDVHRMLREVKALRNGCAHNSCILNNMKRGSFTQRKSDRVSNALSQVDGIGQAMRRTKLSNRRLYQIATTLFLHKTLCSEHAVRSRAGSLHGFIGRCQLNIDLYDESCPVKSSLGFIAKVIKAWYAQEGPDSDQNESPVFSY